MNDELFEKLQEITNELLELEYVFDIDLHTRGHIRNVVMELEVIIKGIREDKE